MEASDNTRRHYFQQVTKAEHEQEREFDSGMALTHEKVRQASDDHDDQSRYLRDQKDVLDFLRYFHVPAVQKRQEA